MISRAVKILSAAAIAAILIGTVAVSGTFHTRTDAAGVQPAQDSALGAASGAMTRSPLHGHGNIACGMLSYSDCETLEMTLPM
jgi:hypothetical protein